MKRSRRLLNVAALVAFGLAFLHSLHSLHAASATWNGATDGNWTESGNWIGGVPGVVGTGTANTDVATFSGTTNTTVTVDATRDIGSIVFDGASTGAFTLSSGALYLYDEGAINVTGNVTTAQTINTGINIIGPGNLTNYSIANNSLNPGVVLSLNTISRVNSSSVSEGLVLGGLGTGVVSGAITGGNLRTNMIKAGSGTWTLQGNNTWGQSASATTFTQFQNGRLVVDYAGATSGTNTDYGLRNTMGLSGGGGTIEFLAKSGSGNFTIQNTGSYAGVNGSGLSTIIVNKNSSDGMILSTGTIARGTGSALLIDVSSGSVFTALGYTNSQTAAVTFIRTSSGVDFATLSSGTLVPFNSSTALPSSGGVAGAAGANNVVNDGFTLGGNTNARTLRVTTSLDGQTLNLGGSTLSIYGSLLFNGTNAYSVSNGTLSGALTTTGATVMNFGTGKLTFESSGLLGSAAGPLAFYGTGLTEIASAANATGAIQIASTVRLSNAAALSLSNAGSGNGSGNIDVQNGGIIELNTSTDLTRNLSATGGAGIIRFVGNGGFSAYGGTRNVNLSSGATLTWGSGGFIANDGTLILGSAHSDGNLNFQNPLDLGSGNRQVLVNSGTVSGDVDGTLSGNLTGAGGMLSKTGDGTLALTGSNSYSGGTMVYAGTLVVNNAAGSATGSGSLTVFAGATLSGTGSVSGAVKVAGTLAPGNSVGAISTGAVQVTGSGAISIELGRSGITPVSDLVTVTGGVTLDSGADLKLTLGSGLNAAQLNDVFFLVNNDDSDLVSGFFTKLNGVTTTLTEGSEFSWNSQNWKITYEASYGSGFSGGNDVALRMIPEPGTMVLVLTSGVALLLRRRNRHQG